MSSSPRISHGFPDRQFWKDVLAIWLRLIQFYEKDNKEKGRGSDEIRDFAYWYGERPLTGLLGAAAWKLPDGWSLEEFGSKRKEEEEKKHGRGDLWLGCGAAKATVEAKIHWVTELMSTAEEHLEKRLNEAKGQLESLTIEYRYGNTISVCYVVPCYKTGEPKQRGIDALDHLESWVHCQNWEVATVKHISDCPDTSSSGEEYPGVLLVARAERIGQ